MPRALGAMGRHEWQNGKDGETGEIKFGREKNDRWVIDPALKEGPW